ncbi:leucyl/phenylalanyl-tRNA--protein transferase [Rhodospirillum centenum]|uniref:Leucyl/phenylalanyl-tRNA--protein transferase n=1 Tax=Rhodospirillum centenum (strain ATCC 51521 / SW) TaxID=414684 RepID=B6ISB8_RHOCS|nr:leucyl/phenylalanyl-tRNA--protein transferase [Rhodospirillum centenum]ACI98354.1 leucyl/phenylalanyl-tRNA--protein transferase, putative [Rhodospirillum centenum SW]
MMLTPDLLLRAYAAGIFPMAESAASDELMWFDPPMRGIMPLDGFHVPRRLRRTIRQQPFTVRCDSAFRGVMEACAESGPGRPQTWINGDILDAYCRLHALGFAHSVECWAGDRLVGGLYGVALGAAFFGESMFSRATDASKVALVHLVARLRAGGYTLLDTQFVTEHLAQFGSVEIPRARYKALLTEALRRPARFQSEEDEGVLVSAFLQSITQTS